MQSETADFVPGAASPPPNDLAQTTSDVRLVLLSGELDETYESSLILAYFVQYMKA